jgi:hypothetical protein
VGGEGLSKGGDRGQDGQGKQPQKGAAGKGKANGLKKQKSSHN